MRKFFFAKILRMTKYTSLPNLVRLGQWEQVSEYIHRTYIELELQPVKIEPDDQIACAKRVIIEKLSITIQTSIEDY